jgi:hypothetical protein
MTAEHYSQNAVKGTLPLVILAASLMASPAPCDLNDLARQNEYLFSPLYPMVFASTLRSYQVSRDF